MLALVLALMATAEGASGFAGLEYRPLSRQDLVFVEEGRTSGTAVGAFDGTIDPVLSAFGGAWFNKYVGLSLGLGVARVTQNSLADDIYRQTHWAVVRPSLDVRLGWMQPRERFPIPWVLVGVYGDIPSARDVSNGFTDEEQAAADRASANESYRLGGVGGRVGFGVDYRILPGLMIGAQVSAGLYQSSYLGGDATFTSTWVATEAAILLTFEWPDAREREARKMAAEAYNQSRADRLRARAEALTPSAPAPDPTVP